MANANQQTMLAAISTMKYIVEPGNKEWYIYDSTLFEDYMQARAAVYAAMLGEGGFGALHVDYQEICAKFVVVDRASQLSVLTEAEKDLWTNSFHREATIARKDRILKIELLALKHIPLDEGEPVLRSLEENGLVRKFIRYGIIGSQHGNTLGILDFFNDLCDYSTTGFTSMGPYNPYTITVTEFITKVNNIIIYGQEDYP